MDRLVPELDPTKIPAFMRRRQLKIKASQPLYLTAWDRQKAGLIKESKPEKPLVTALDRKKAGLLIKRKKIGSKITHKKVKVRPVYTSGVIPSVCPPGPQKFLNEALIFEKIASGWKEIGIVTHFFPKIKVVVIALESDLRLQEQIKIGEAGQIVDSMQINKRPVDKAYAGDEIGLKVTTSPLVGERVYKYTDYV